ncbi:hypothetical protein [Algicella marina]|uniref:Lipoprotein n=1 Tax=Algicella marina TaxID=2683284 RepID=A0A6P1SZ38_9RHOB|nr:hypothetical protein [Algicella marina]QHQ34880.1 hypothetical protein GO499_06525 [Algicella marina]
MKKLIILGCLLVAACAKAPEEISAANIGPNPYTHASCGDLRSEEVRLSQHLTNLSAAQRDAQSGDALGVFLLGLPISSMAGNDKEAEISVTKGRIQAVEQVRIGKRCA